MLSGFTRKITRVNNPFDTVLYINVCHICHPHIIQRTPALFSVSSSALFSVFRAVQRFKYSVLTYAMDLKIVTPLGSSQRSMYGGPG